VESYRHRQRRSDSSAGNSNLFDEIVDRHLPSAILGVGRSEHPTDGQDPLLLVFCHHHTFLARLRWRRFMFVIQLQAPPTD